MKLLSITLFIVHVEISWAVTAIAHDFLSFSKHVCKWNVKLNPRILMKNTNLIDKIAENIAKDAGASSLGQVGELHGYYLYQSFCNKSAHIMNHLITHDHVEWLRQESFLIRVKRVMPNANVFQPRSLSFADPLYHEQWHLKNNIKGHKDCNVTGVWTYNITGKGVVVAVVDDGVEWRHPDLIENYCAEGSFDLNSNDDDPSPTFDKKEENKHGTRCAGEIAAVPNDVCGIGIAYGSKFSGIRVLDGPTTDSMEATAFNKHMDVNDIYSCSWGPEDNGLIVDGPHELAQAALRHGVLAGREGFGSIYVVASGNGGDSGDNCNFDGYANSVYTITIGAVDEIGQIPSYAERCASMLACVVSSGSGFERSIVTTDWSLGKGNKKDQCTRSHTGTSAATPLAAGMVALMLEVRPCLSWRDVQHIIVMTAVKIDHDTAWVKNSAGFMHSDIHGFGLLNAWKVVNAATIWEPVPWLVSIVGDTSAQNNIEIPDGNNPVELNAIVTEKECKEHMLETLEYVVFTLTLSHPSRGFLKFILQCPSGTASVVPTRPKDTSSDGLTEWSFSTVRCWGENPEGKYVLKILDTRKSSYFNKLGTLKYWKLKIYGSQWSAADMQERLGKINLAMSGEYLSPLANYTISCPPAEPLNFDIVTFTSERTIKLVAMLSCFLVFWAIYYSLEMMFCNNEDKKTENESSAGTLLSNDITHDPHTSASGMQRNYQGVNTFPNEAFNENFDQISEDVEVQQRESSGTVKLTVDTAEDSPINLGLTATG